MYVIRKNNIYKHRFDSLKYIFLLEDAYDEDDFLSCLDLDTFEVINLYAYQIYNRVVDSEELDDDLLQSDFKIKMNQFEKNFVYHIDYFSMTKKTLSDREDVLTLIDDTFFTLLDMLVRYESDDIDTDSFKARNIKILRAAHKQAIDKVWQIGAVII